ncbi:MAG: serine hydrolase domain-containing protein, partial [Candidatus Neomarinimicrobiota bacterium]
MRPRKPFRECSPVILPVWAGVFMGSLLLATACNSPEGRWDPKIFAPAVVVIERAIQDSVFPGAVLLVGQSSGEPYTRAFGSHDYSAQAVPTESDHLFDLASLTKVMATTLAIMNLYEDGAIQLDAPVARYLPAFAQSGKGQVTVRNLLVHNSGFPPGKPFYLFTETEEEAYDSLFAMPLRYATGTATVYSDLSFITLGRLVEVITGLSLETYVEQAFYRPLGLQHTLYEPPRQLWSGIVPTEPEFNFRLTHAQGQAKNKITRLMNGVAGHAGLFSNVHDLAKVARMLLDSG